MKRKLMLIDHYQMLGRIVYWASKMDTSQLHTLYIMITKRGSEPRIKQVIKTKQKALPKRKTKRKFSRKQLAAQRLFTKRAKAGTLRKRRK
tara:strand:+ start:166 stop:438 length:273 start_codon:yes stop_codon:yes gene_type:complete